MNETMEKAPETITEAFKPKLRALEFISDSGIPTEVKQHFSDIIQILGNETKTSGGSRAKQVMDIADELNMAKRQYLNDNELEDDPGMNELIHNIVQFYIDI